MKDINFLVNDAALGAKAEAEKPKSVPAAKIIVVVLIVTVAAFVLFIPGIIIAGMQDKTVKIEESMLDVKYRELRNVKAQLQSVTGKVNNKKAIINDINTKTLSASQIVLMVENAVPAGCYITSLKYTGSTLELKGVAESSFVYAELLTNLDRLKLLSRNTGSLDIEQTTTSIVYTIQYSVAKSGGQ